jgi:CHAD domain-containing protein
LLSLKAVLARDLVGHRQRVRDELTSDKWIAFRVRLLELPETVARLSSESDGRHDRSDLRSLAGRALAKHWRRVAKAGRQLDRLTIAERHELRKELKVLRYTAELFSSLYPQKIVHQFLAKLRRLQDAFGYLNDVAVAEKLTSINQGSAIRTPDMQRAVGYVIGWHTAHAQVAWQELGEEWREFARAPKFWSHR